MSRFSMSVRDGKELLALLERHLDAGQQDRCRALVNLRAALSPRRKTGRQRASAQAKRIARGKKKEETASIRQTVFLRADGRCEICKTRAPAELHHAFGRVQVQQAVSNTLALCRACHRLLTVATPSASYWWLLQAEHFERHVYSVEAEMARARAAKKEALYGATAPQPSTGQGPAPDGRSDGARWTRFPRR